MPVNTFNVPKFGQPHQQLLKYHFYKKIKAVCFVGQFLFNFVKSKIFRKTPV